MRQMYTILKKNYVDKLLLLDKWCNNEIVLHKTIFKTCRRLIFDEKAMNNINNENKYSQNSKIYFMQNAVLRYWKIAEK